MNAFVLFVMWSMVAGVCYTSWLIWRITAPDPDSLFPQTKIAGRVIAVFLVAMMVTLVSFATWGLFNGRV